MINLSYLLLYSHNCHKIGHKQSECPCGMICRRCGESGYYINLDSNRIVMLKQIVLVLFVVIVVLNMDILLLTVQMNLVA